VGGLPEKCFPAVQTVKIFRRRRQLMRAIYRRASDGEIIIVRNTTSAGGLVPIFEARVDSPYAYLNSGFFLSSNPGVANGGVKITMYESTNSK
jgi:hypothetical protein